MLATVILYPIARHCRRAYTNIICPVTILVVYCTFSQIYGNLDVGNGFNFIVMDAQTRALAGTCFGSICYCAYLWLEKKNIGISLIAIDCAAWLMLSASILIAVFGSDHSLRNSHHQQYGKWGSFGIYGFIIITIGGITLTYFLIFAMSLLKRFSPVKKAFCFLGENPVYILMLPIVLAETVCWLGGFWYDVYNEPFDPANISIPHYLITVIGTIAGLAIFFIGRYLFKNKKNKVYYS